MKQIAELEGHDLFAGLDNIVFRFPLGWKV